MLCLSLWQPWASLIAVGAKDIETRDWAPPASVIGHTIAIHAAKRPVAKSLEFIDPDNLPRLDQVFAGVDWRHALPLGAIVCVARLVGAYRFGPEIFTHDDPGVPAVAVASRVRGSPWRSAIYANPWGNYTEGRWGWHLELVRALPEPLPVRGRQGLFLISSAEAARALPQ